ncbi:unannotated protein [freshwater metagenome]|uniref:Unannotated protein n=1 Tax=freshwater metagenome TaxID=449393 RepID=A0A6J6EY94_9ZZZZ
MTLWRASTSDALRSAIRRRIRSLSTGARQSPNRSTEQPAGNRWGWRVVVISQLAAVGCWVSKMNSSGQRWRAWECPSVKLKLARLFAVKVPCSRLSKRLARVASVTSSQRFKASRTKSFAPRFREFLLCRAGRARERPWLRCTALRTCSTRIDSHSKDKASLSLVQTVCSLATSNKYFHR